MMVCSFWFSTADEKGVEGSKGPCRSVNAGRCLEMYAIGNIEEWGVVPCSDPHPNPTALLLGSLFSTIGSCSRMN